MSDARAREAERRWRETSASGDEARLLLERVRAGDLDRRRLALAARLGDPAAGLAAGEARAGTLEALVASLGPAEREVGLRLGLAGLRAAVEVSDGGFTWLLQVAARALQAHVDDVDVLARARAEVAPWLLGRGDPLRAR